MVCDTIADLDDLLNPIDGTKRKLDFCQVAGATWCPLNSRRCWDKHRLPTDRARFDPVIATSGNSPSARRKADSKIAAPGTEV